MNLEQGMQSMLGLASLTDEDETRTVRGESIAADCHGLPLIATDRHLIATDCH